MLTETQTTKPATDILTDLVLTARIRRNAAINQGHAKRAQDFDNVAQTLDRVRTRLVQDGPEYLDAAWAFIDGGRKIIVKLTPNVNA